MPNAAELLLIYRLILEQKARMARGFHVLIVEDEPLVLDVLQTMLETLYHVSSAPTVAEAQAILRTSHIDVALIDSVLPDGRGADVAVLAYNVGAAVIEMTGDPQEHIGLVASGRPHLFKPFRANVLLATVGDALHGHQRSALGTESMAAKTSSRETAALPP